MPPRSAWGCWYVVGEGEFVGEGDGFGLELLDDGGGFQFGESPVVLGVAVLHRAGGT